MADDVHDCAHGAPPGAPLRAASCLVLAQLPGRECSGEGDDRPCVRCRSMARPFGFETDQGQSTVEAQASPAPAGHEAPQARPATNGRRQTRKCKRTPQDPPIEVHRVSEDSSPLKPTSDGPSDLAELRRASEEDRFDAVYSRSALAARPGRLYQGLVDLAARLDDRQLDQLRLRSQTRRLGVDRHPLVALDEPSKNRQRVPAARPCCHEPHPRR